MTQSGQVKVVRWLRFVSLVASAPVWAGLAFLILAFLEPVNLALLLVSLVFATVAPVMGTALFTRSQGVSFDIPLRSLRIKPFLLAIISYSLGTVLLSKGQAPALVTGLMFAYAVNTTVMLVVTLYWKISVHAAGVVGPLSFLVYRLGLWSTFLYAFVIPVAMLKLRLKEHSVAQLMAGSMLTIAITWLQILFLVPIVP